MMDGVRTSSSGDAAAQGGMTSGAPVLSVRGGTLQYKTPRHLVTATYLGGLRGLLGRPFRRVGSVGMRQDGCPAEHL
jgi:hypothetical protein